MWKNIQINTYFDIPRTPSHIISKFTKNGDHFVHLKSQKKKKPQRLALFEYHYE